MTNAYLTVLWLCVAALLTPRFSVPLAERQMWQMFAGPVEVADVPLVKADTRPWKRKP